MACVLCLHCVHTTIFARGAGKFSCGFDINNLFEVQKTGNLSLLPDVSIDLIMKTIEEAKKPSVAAIHGPALGGGLELAMGCHARISTPDALLGLPELSLGVIPGFGGTQRLPRLVGLQKAVKMMLFFCTDLFCIFSPLKQISIRTVP
ncbi:hypothetical protein HPP92_008617 [Vanilla planifolia]|uniref:Uncharacterized protein n=1 Tax=Vanilla planifolia TaxID=51239 RepID=A0A835RIB4_VANPL|nr:hypothetical protein HPP92_008617 [Vanilla planifolia]